MSDLRINAWLDSGANVHSRRKFSILVSEMGYTVEDWDNMSEADQEKQVYDYISEYFDWGYEVEEVQR